MTAYYVSLDMVAYPLLASEPDWQWSAYCTFDAQIILNATGVTALNPWDPNNGGGGRVTPKLHSTVAKTDGSVVSSANVGDVLVFNLGLEPGDTTYEGVLPQICYFSNSPSWDAPGAAKLKFIDNGCSIGNLPDMIINVTKNKDGSYQTFFRAFQFQSGSTAYSFLYLLCQVQLCLTSPSCATPGCDWTASAFERFPPLLLTAMLDQGQAQADLSTVPVNLPISIRSASAATTTPLPSSIPTGRVQDLHPDPGFSICSTAWRECCWPCGCSAAAASVSSSRRGAGEAARSARRSGK